MAKRPDEADKLTMSVEEAGQALGLGRAGAYEAVARGEIPTVRIGRRLLVPIRAVDAMLDRAVADWERRREK